MLEFLTQTYYGNTGADWAIAFAIAIGAFVLGKIAYWLIRGVLRAAASRTSTRYDGMFLDMIDEPVVVIVTVVGLWFAVRWLTLPEGVEIFAWGAVQAAITMAAAWMLARMFDALTRNVLQPLVDETETDLDDQLLPVIRKGGKTAIWALGVVMALNNAGYDVLALIAGLGLGGLALAMAAQDTIKNVFGGFTIFTDRPFAVGDRIAVSGFDGVVTEIGVRTTRLRTLAGRQVTIPNSSIANTSVENITSEPSRKVTMTLGLTYDTPPGQMRRAMEALREIVDDQGDDMDGDPIIGFSGFGEFSMNILFIYYIRSGHDVTEVSNNVNLAILERFNDEELEFAFPTQTILTPSLESRA